jgi:hypothetical protein
VVSGSVRMVTWELSAAELSNTEGVSGEAERWRVVPEVLVVHDEEGGDCTRRCVSTRTARQTRVTEKMRTSGRRPCVSSLALSRHALFAAGSPSCAAAESNTGVLVKVGVGERRFLDSIPISISFSGVPGTTDGAGTGTRAPRVGDVTSTGAGRGGTDFTGLAGLLENNLPSCLLATLLGEHALGSSAPRTRRLTGDVAFMLGDFGGFPLKVYPQKEVGR